MKISLKFVRRGLINNIPALVQIMVCDRPGNKPLTEPMMVILLMQICAPQLQWARRMPKDLVYMRMSLYPRVLQRLGNIYTTKRRSAHDNDVRLLRYSWCIVVSSRTTLAKHIQLRLFDF